MDKKDKRSFDLTHFLDSHVRYLQYIPYTVMCVGLYVMGKRLRVTSKFTSVAEVPDDFVSKRIRLRGKVVNIEKNCDMMIDHLPILHRPWSKSEHKQNGLVIKLLGVHYNFKDNTHLVGEHLNNLSGQEIWFQLWQKSVCDDNVPYLSCVITKKSWPLNRCINAEVLRAGWAQRSVDEQLDRASDWSTKLLRRKLNRAEAYAKRKKLGIWKSPSALELMQSNLTNKKDTALKTGMGIIDKGKSLVATVKAFLKKFQR